MPTLDPAGPQNWQRTSTGPTLALGDAGSFDDMHLFAPFCAKLDDGRYWLWYSGSRGTVPERVYKLGLAHSDDGVSFTKHAGNPVLAMPGNQSVLTATLLRHPDGTLCRVDGKLRMWFSSADFTRKGDHPHTLHATTGSDGLTWDTPTDALLHNAYAPSVLLEDGVYRLWYTDVTQEPWVLRYAQSHDGLNWDVRAEPALALDDAHGGWRGIYPHVMRFGRTYAMWFSYWLSGERRKQVATGCALSDDGLTWRFHPDDPVLEPDPTRPWESMYTSCACMLPEPDGSLRAFYGVRNADFSTHKYFGVGTAVWSAS